MKYTVNTKSKLFIYTFSIWYVIDNLMSMALDGCILEGANFLNKILSYIVLFLLIFQIVVFSKYKQREFIVIVAVSVGVGLVTLQSHNNYMMSLWLFIVASKEINYNNIVRVAYLIVSITLVLVFVLCVVEILPDITMIRNSESSFIEIRHSMGFVHPNILGMKMLQWLIYRVYLYRKNILANFILIILVTSFNYFIPNSQTPVMLSTILAICLVIYYLHVFFGLSLAKFGKVMICVSVALNIISIILCSINLETNKFLKKIDKLLSIRFSQSNKVLKVYGIKILGQPVFLTESERQANGLSGHLFLDNAYMSLLIKFGIIMFILFFTAYIVTMYRLLKNKQLMLVIIFFIYSIYGVMEPAMYRFTYNIMLIWIGNIIFNSYSIGQDDMTKKRKD